MKQNQCESKSQNNNALIITLPQETHSHSSNRKVGKISSSSSLPKVNVCFSPLPSKFAISPTRRQSSTKDIQVIEDLVAKLYHQPTRDDSQLSVESEDEIYSLSDVSYFDLNDNNEDDVDEKDINNNNDNNIIKY